MSLHAQVPTPPTPTVPVEPVDPAGLGGWFLEYFTQPVATVLGSLGIIFAALITYKVGSKNRKQLEEHHTATHTLAATQALRDRFTTITTQLADPAPAIRTAAVSALEALADDWLDRKKPRETQACINVLCDYLRTPYEPPTRNPHLRKETRRTHRTKYDYTDTTHEYPHDDLDTRHAITRTIAAHLQEGHDHSWSPFVYDFTGAYLHDLDLTGAKFGQGAEFRAATFSGDHTSFKDAQFSDYTSFVGATFRSEYTIFDGAKFRGTTRFEHTRFSGQNTSFRDARFSGKITLFRVATFSGEYTSFDNARFSSKSNSFVGATFSGDHTSFDNARFNGDNFNSFSGPALDGHSTSFRAATFSGEYTSFEGTTFSGETSFRAATFSGEHTSFEGTRFDGENILFEDPRAWGNVTMDWERHPRSVFGPLRPQPASVVPHEWPPVPKP